MSVLRENGRRRASRRSNSILRVSCCILHAACVIGRTPRTFAAFNDIFDRETERERKSDLTHSSFRLSVLNYLITNLLLLIIYFIRIPEINLGAIYQKRKNTKLTVSCLRFDKF